MEWRSIPEISGYIISEYGDLIRLSNVVQVKRHGVETRKQPQRKVTPRVSNKGYVITKVKRETISRNCRSKRPLMRGYAAGQKFSFL